MSDSIGALRARVTLQQPTRVADEVGGAAILWSDAADVWAEISADGLSEGADYDTAISSGAYSITINRLDGVRAGWRVLWNGRRFRATGVRDNGGPRVVLVCQEDIL